MSPSWHASKAIDAAALARAQARQVVELLAAAGTPGAQWPGVDVGLAGAWAAMARRSANQAVEQAREAAAAAGARTAVNRAIRVAMAEAASALLEVARVERMLARYRAHYTPEVPAVAVPIREALSQGGAR